MLLFQLWKYVDKMEFFHKAGPTVTKTQTGVVRLDHQMTLLCKKKIEFAAHNFTPQGPTARTAWTERTLSKCTLASSCYLVSWL